MILFLFLILIILVTICIYKNYFSNQEGNTIYVENCSREQYIKNGVCTDMEGSTATDLSGQCLNHFKSDSTSDYFNFSNILDYIGTKPQIKLNNTNPETYDSCNLDDYEHKDSFVSNDIFNINTSLLPQTPAVTCDTTTKKVKGNLYCKYNTAVNDTVITGDISCVDVSDFKDVEWYRNVANYSFEYTNDGSRDKLHYVCKDRTTINGDDSDNSGSILASDWAKRDGVKCKCPDVDGQIQFYYDGNCNEKPEYSTIGEGGKNINNADVATHGPGDCKGRWSQVESCKKLDNKVTFKAEFVTEYGNVDGNGLPNGNYYSTSCEKGGGEENNTFSSSNGVEKEGNKYIKYFDCDQSCGQWKPDEPNNGCTASKQWKYNYKDASYEFDDISRNQCYFEVPNIPGVVRCYNGNPNDMDMQNSFIPPTNLEEVDIYSQSND